jgi:MFS family permease
LNQSTSEVIPQQSLWRHPNFLRLWSSETISSFGAQFSELAIPLTAVLLLQGTPLQLGILNAAVTAPFLLFSLIAGVWIDRHRRRSFLITSNIGRAILLATIPLAAATGHLSIILLLGVAFLVGTLRVFFDIAYQSFLPGIVEREQLVDANSRLEASRAVSSAAGPSVAGGVIQVLTAPFAIAFDAVSFIFSTLFLSKIDYREPQPDRSDRQSVMAEMRQGLRIVVRDPRLRSLAGAGSTANFFEFAIMALFLLYAVNLLNLQPDMIGIILGAGATGAIAGALLAGKLASRIGTGPAILTSLVLGVTLWGPLIYLATPTTAVPLLIVAWFFGEVAFVAWSINQSSFRQAVCPANLQGRVNATMRFLSAGVVPLGSIVGGILGDILGPHLAIGVAAVGLLLAPLWLVFSPVLSVKKLGEAETIGFLD